MDKVTEKVINAVDELWNKQLSFLQKMVSYPSVLLNEAKAQQFFKNELIRMGLYVDTFDVDVSKICKMPGYAPTEWSYQGRPQVVGVLKSSSGTGRSLVLNGHMDVVPTGSLRYWTYDPWSGVIEGDRLYGRGSADMKGGLSAIVYAVKALQKEGIELAGDVIIQSVIEEEAGGNGTLACLARGYTGDGCLIPEPLGDGITLGTGGILWLRTKVPGKPGHPMAGRKAVNAIENAYYVMQGLKELEAKWNESRHPQYEKMEHPINFVFGSIKAGEFPSLPPDECIFETRIGFSPSLKAEQAKTMLLEFMQQYVSKNPFLKENPPEFTWYAMTAEGVVLDKNCEFIKTVAMSHRKVRGQEPEYFYVTGNTDHRFWPLYYGLPAVSYGPTGGGFHGHDEYIDLPSLLQTTKVIAQFIIDWCGVNND